MSNSLRNSRPRKRSRTGLILGALLCVAAALLGLKAHTTNTDIVGHWLAVALLGLIGLVGLVALVNRVRNWFSRRRKTAKVTSVFDATEPTNWPAPETPQW